MLSVPTVVVREKALLFTLNIRHSDEDERLEDLDA